MPPKMKQQIPNDILFLELRKEKKIVTKSTSMPSQTSHNNLPIEDVSTLSAHSPELMEKQATINIGVIGHVAHGKSTVVSAISHARTNTHSEEQQRNITIHLGYANAKLYQRDDALGATPGENYKSTGSSQKDLYDHEKKILYHIDRLNIRWNLVRHISFVDCPGHDILIATMLSGAAVMDAALLLVAGNVSCPQPQTMEHLTAVTAMNLQHLIILQNKIDLVSQSQAERNYNDIKAFLQTSRFSENNPIIPISAVKGIGINVVIESLCKTIPTPVRDFTSAPILTVIRSFEVNRPGETVENLVGGVAGGSVLRGIFRLGEEIEVRPGLIRKDTATGKIQACQPFISTIRSLRAEKNNLDLAAPGGLVAIGTDVDPYFTRNDRLAGMIIGKRGNLPDVFIKIRIQFRLFRKALGVEQEANSDRSQNRISPLRSDEVIKVTILSNNEVATIKSVVGNRANLELSQPVCTGVGERLAIQRKLGGKWRLIGLATVESGETLEIIDA